MRDDLLGGVRAGGDAQFARDDRQGLSLEYEDRPVNPQDGSALLRAQEGFRRVRSHNELGTLTTVDKIQNRRILCSLKRLES